MPVHGDSPAAWSVEVQQPAWLGHPSGVRKLVVVLHRWSEKTFRAPSPFRQLTTV